MTRPSFAIPNIQVHFARDLQAGLHRSTVNGQAALTKGHFEWTCDIHLTMVPTNMVPSR